VRQKARELERVHHEMETELGRSPNNDELAERMGMTRKELDATQQKVRGSTVLSLEEHIPSDRGSDLPLLDTLRSDGPEISASFEQSEVRRLLLEALEELNHQERTVISLYYFEGQTLKDIKAVLGVSESRVSQIHAQAVIRLRNNLRVLRGDLGFRENDRTLKQKYVRKPLAEGA
jgi:RNA polymerase sigma factor for flagellar operon FliA